MATKSAANSHFWKWLPQSLRRLAAPRVGIHNYGSPSVSANRKARTIIPPFRGQFEWISGGGGHGKKSLASAGSTSCAIIRRVSNCSVRGLSRPAMNGVILSVELRRGGRRKRNRCFHHEAVRTRQNNMTPNWRQESKNLRCCPIHIGELASGAKKDRASIQYPPDAL